MKSLKKDQISVNKDMDSKTTVTSPNSSKILKKPLVINFIKPILANQQNNAISSSSKSSGSNLNSKTQSSDDYLQSDANNSSLNKQNLNSDENLQNNIKNLYLEKNEKLINDFFDTTTKMIEEKLNNFTKTIFSTMFDKNDHNEISCLIETRRKKFVMSNHQLNKFNRLNEMLQCKELLENETNSNLTYNWQTENNKKCNKRASLFNDDDKNASKYDNCRIPNKIAKTSSFKAGLEVEEEEEIEEIDAYSNVLHNENNSSLSRLQISSKFNSQVTISNIKPKLKIETQKNETTSSVILTWTLIKLFDNQIVDENDPFLKTIIEYEIYGQKKGADDDDDIDDVDHEINPNALTKIGSINTNNAPPISCTLTDFINGSFYYFSVRVKDKNDKLSAFANITKIKI